MSPPRRVEISLGGSALVMAGVMVATLWIGFDYLGGCLVDLTDAVLAVAAELKER